MKINKHEYRWIGPITHGETIGRIVSPEYLAYQQIMQRCYNPENPAYKNYGGRGIVLYSEWKDNPSIFVKWIVENLGRKPSVKSTLGRIDNSKNYEPGNLRWETRTQQARNRRTNKLTMAEAREIRMLYDRGYSQRELAREFSVSQRLVFDIIHEKIWK